MSLQTLKLYGAKTDIDFLILKFREDKKFYEASGIGNPFSMRMPYPR